MTSTRLVVLAVATALVLSIVGIVVLALQAQTIPDVLQNVAVGALTGLVGLLVPTRAERRADEKTWEG